MDLIVTSTVSTFEKRYFLDLFYSRVVCTWQSRDLQSKDRSTDSVATEPHKMVGVLASTFFVAHHLLTIGSLSIRYSLNRTLALDIGLIHLLYCSVSFSLETSEEDLPSTMDASEEVPGAKRPPSKSSEQPAKKPHTAAAALNSSTSSSLQQQIQQQLQEQLQQQLQAAAARGQQASITPEQIQGTSTTTAS